MKLKIFQKWFIFFTYHISNLCHALDITISFLLFGIGSFKTCHMKLISRMISMYFTPFVQLSLIHFTITLFLEINLENLNTQLFMNT